MSPSEALQLIENIRMRFAISGMTGADHDAFRQAIQVLAQAIAPVKPAPPTPLP